MGTIPVTELIYSKLFAMNATTNTTNEAEVVNKLLTVKSHAARSASWGGVETSRNNPLIYGIVSATLCARIAKTT